MEPTLSQIKEYVREKGIDIFSELHLDSQDTSTSLGYGTSNTEAYYQYYLEHSVEIVEWFSKELSTDNSFRNIR